MNVVLFGGAFNPPHLGHLVVIQQAFELIPHMDELWIVPAYRHTFQKHLAPTAHRVQMTRLLMQEIPNSLKNRVKLETVEVDNRLSGETYDSLQLLQKKFPNYDFSFLMGSDNLKYFKRWGNWQKLIQQMQFFIYPRAGYRNHIEFTNMSLLSSPTQVVTNISSTLIRKRIMSELMPDNLIHKSVLDYIKLNNLY